MKKIVKKRYITLSNKKNKLWSKKIKNSCNLGYFEITCDLKTFNKFINNLNKNKITDLNKIDKLGLVIDNKFDGWWK